MRREIEASVHQNVCDYLRLQYPGVLFHTDFGSGIKLTIGQAARQKRLQSGRAWPDLFIARKKTQTSSCGLFIEVKSEGTKIYLKDGVTMVANEHFREQEKVMQLLRNEGYSATFSCGFDEAKNIIDEYLS